MQLLKSLLRLVRSCEKWLIVLILISAQSPLLSQEDKVTIRGQIKDKETGEDLIGASVYVVETGEGTVSNPYGFYSLTLKPGKYMLHVSFVGYQKVTQLIELNVNQTLNYELSMEENELEEVVVVSEAEDLNVTSTQMSVAKIDVSSIKQMPTVFGEADLIKSIQLLPGVSSGGETSGGFNVRGGAADQNLILLDEATIFNTSHLFGLVSVFNADAIKDVTLLKGGIPAYYGGRLSSVLDVRQKEGNSKKFSGSAGIGLLSSRLNLEGPIDKGKGSFLLAGRRSYVDLFLPAVIDDPPSVVFYDVNLKANYTIDERNRLFLSGYFGRDLFGIDDLLDNDWGNLAINLRYNHILNDQLFSNFSIIYSDYRYNFDIQRSDGYIWEAHIENLNFKSDFSLFLEGDSQLDFGANLLYYDFNPGQITPNAESNLSPINLDPNYAFEPAAYISYKARISRQFSLESGLRLSGFLRMGQEDVRLYENNDPVVFNSQLGRYEKGTPNGSTSYGTGEVINDFYNLEPRLALNYQINQTSSLKASYNRSAQYIHLISNSTSPTALNIWVPSGPYIEPQTSHQWAIGYFRNFKENAYEASIEAFYKEMDNQIDYVDGADIQLNNHIETELLTGTGRAYGLEVYLKKNRGKFTGWLSYTWSRSERQVPGLGQGDSGINGGEYYLNNFDRTHDLSLTTFYKLSDRVSLSANFIYQTGMPTTYPASRYEFAGLVGANYEGRNQARLPDNHRLDLSLTLKPRKKKRWDTSWVFSLYNVYNNKNAYDVTFSPNNASRDADISDFFIRKYDTEATQNYIGFFPNITYNIKF